MPAMLKTYTTPYLPTQNQKWEQIHFQWENAWLHFDTSYFSNYKLQLPDITRVQTIKNLGVTISDRLSLNQHGTNVIVSRAQTFHALRILRAHGLNKDALEGVFKAVVIAKLTYACPAWWGFTTARPAENGSCHPLWSAFRRLLHQPGSSSRTRRSSR